jgi:hypothetical protein
MWPAIIAHFSRALEMKRRRRERQEEILAEGPSWRYRRRLIHGAYAMGIGMILFGGITFFYENQVSVEMIIGGVALVSIIVTAYTTSATYEDVRIWNQDKRIRFGSKDDVVDDDMNPDGI